VQEDVKPKSLWRPIGFTILCGFLIVFSTCFAAMAASALTRSERMNDIIGTILMAGFAVGYSIVGLGIIWFFFRMVVQGVIRFLKLFKT
jgi:ABC-type Fe3+ transport system permease subunit